MSDSEDDKSLEALDTLFEIHRGSIQAQAAAAQRQASLATPGDAEEHDDDDIAAAAAAASSAAAVVLQHPTQPSTPLAQQHHHHHQPHPHHVHRGMGSGSGVSGAPPGHVVHPVTATSTNGPRLGWNETLPPPDVDHTSAHHPQQSRCTCNARLRPTICIDFQFTSLVWNEMLRGSRQYTLFKKVVRLLQDNRVVNADDPETARQLNELNRTQTDSYPILKTILNGVFVTIGVVLLLGVLAAIAYTSMVKPGSSDDILRYVLQQHDEDEPSQSAPVEHPAAPGPPAALQFSAALGPDLPDMNNIGNIDEVSSSSRSSLGAGIDGGADGPHPAAVNPVKNESSSSDSVQYSPIIQALASRDSTEHPPSPRSTSRINPQNRHAQLPSAATVTPSTAVPDVVVSAAATAAHRRSSGTIVKCQYVPVVYRGQTEVQLRQICFQVPVDEDSDDVSENSARQQQWQQQQQQQQQKK